MKNPVESKKGLTLVELIAASAISVIIMAAACTMLYVGSKSAHNGAASFVNHGDAYLLETQLRNNLFRASDISTKNSIMDLSPDDSNNFVIIHLDSEGNVLCETKSKDSTKESSVESGGIKSLKLSVETDGKKQTLLYDITAENGKKPLELSGGIVMGNLNSTVSFPSTELKKSDTDNYFVITVPRK